MLSRLLKFSSVVFFFLYPLFYLPLTADSYEYNKMTLLIIFIVYMSILISLKWIQEKKIPVAKNTFILPLLLLTGIIVISTLFQTPNMFIAFTTPLATTTMIAGLFLYTILLQSVETEEKEQYSAILVVDASIIALYVLLLYSGLIPKGVFTPAGSILSTATFLTILASYSITRFIVSLKLRTELLSHGDQDDDEIQMIQNKSLFYGVTSGLISLACLFAGYHLITDQIPVILPMQYGWAIALEVYKNIKTLLLGIGPSNFLTAFSLAKPLSINSSPVWNIIFTNSSSFFLTLATEAGVLAGIIYLYMTGKGIKLLRDVTIDSPLASVNPRLSYVIPMLVSLILLFLLPVSMVVYISTIIFLSFAAYTEKPKIIHLARLHRLAYLLIIPSLILAGITGYFGGRAYMAEYTFKQSLNYLVNNQGTQAYNAQRDAIRYNPYIDRYRVAFSQTNLALANALAGNKEAPKEEKEKIPNLVQQAIDEARVAVSLYRTNIINWDNLATTYSSIMGYADGADTWAIQSYQQKILLDPAGPSSRMGLGGLYLALQRYPDAENVFKQAISLKPDFANAYFNLAVSLRFQGKKEEAQQALEQAKRYLPAGSPDIKTIEGELGHLLGTVPQPSTESAQITENSAIQEASPTGTLKNLPSTAPTIKIPSPTKIR